METTMFQASLVDVTGFSLWMIALFIGVGVASWAVLLRVDHRLIVWWGRRRAPEPAQQELEFSSRFGETAIVKVDPRLYTISVARMNAIANTFGYYYIGEHGNGVGSTKVAFQRLPGPPPARIPTLHNGWTKIPM
ncbi:hypothetical protein HCA44_04475 [Rhodococcus sp. HNM0569]|nr:hypothetical protein [Rhodococcus sp. HNM0569]